jgi:hypothetical protein
MGIDKGLNGSVTALVAIERPFVKTNASRATAIQKLLMKAT